MNNKEWQSLRYEIYQEVYKIMGKIWFNRTSKDKPFHQQIRDMVDWKPKWIHDEKKLTQEEINKLNCLADLAEQYDSSLKLDKKVEEIMEEIN